MGLAAADCAGTADCLYLRSSYRRYPHAGGAPHLIGLAFGNGAERFSAFLFLAVLPVGLPAALMIAAGFWHALFDLEWTLWGIQLLTLLGVFLLGLRGARSSGNLQLLIALAILGLTLLIWFKGISAGATPPVRCRRRTSGPPWPPRWR